MAKTTSYDDKTYSAVPGRTPPGAISIHEIYTLEEAKARLGWTDSALRAAKRRGLQLLRCGKRRYVSGVFGDNYSSALATIGIPVSSTNGVWAVIA